jgi:hypothetical protein
LQVVSALTTALTINPPTGTPVDGQKLMFRIKDDGVAKRTLTFAQTGANCYRVAGVILPGETVLGKVLHVGCIYNAIGTGNAASPIPTWDVIAVAQQL